MRDPFDGRAPISVRAIRWRYWFTSLAEKRATGNWWRRGEETVYGSSAGELDVRTTRIPSAFPDPHHVRGGSVHTAAHMVLPTLTLAAWSLAIPTIFFGVRKLA